MQKIKRTRKIYHKPLTLNLEGLIKPRDDRVDFQPGEKEQSKEPIRPPEWKEKPVHTGKLVMQFCGPPEMETKVPAHLTLVRAHRPPKAKETHIERALKAESLDEDFIFEEVPAGDYAVVCQVKGYRPFVRFLQVNRRKLVLPLGSPMHRVQNREEEDVLLRLFERHPFVENVRRFLTRFGYLQDHSESNYDVLDPQISAALRLFQRTFHLHATGELTVETLLLMLRPRCAFPDVIHDSAQRSSTGPTGIEANDPIVFMSDRWDSFNLRYRLFDGTTDISNEWPLIRASMDRWAQVSPLTFRQVYEGNSDLEFDFRQPSESGYPFDKGGNKGGNVLAHAWGPANGTVEFDDYEDWGSTSLPAVSTHEIGHALGLAHCSVSDATMYSWYNSGMESLHEVDVRGIKSLYAPVFYHTGPFVAYPLYAFNSEMGTDSVTIDLGSVRHFLAWGTITMIDSLVDFDRDNMCYIDIFEVDGNRTDWRVSGGDHFGSPTSPGNVYPGAYVGYGQRIKFRIVAGHVSDLEAAGYAIVLVLS